MATTATIMGWVVQEREPGVFDASDTLSPAISPGFDTFVEAVAHVVSEVFGDDSVDAPADWNSAAITFDPYV